MASPDGKLFPGTKRFEIIRPLGSGGMGVVYEAFDRERKQLLALKTLQQLSPQAIYRFKREFRSLAEIVHPNLIPLYELFADGEDWFFTMKIIDDGVGFLDYLGQRSTAYESESMTGIASDDRLKESLETRHLPSDAGDSESTENEATQNLPYLQAGPAPSESIENAATQHLPSAVQLLSQEKTIRQIPLAPPSEDAELTRKLEFSPATASVENQPRRTKPKRKLSLDGAQIERLRDVLRQLVEGVSAIHRAGTLHRDLKPANVLVRAKGQVVILDFGLAIVMHDDLATLEQGSTPKGSLVSSASSDTTTGSIAGTVAYMSPEQAAGRPLTEASDWYSVGVMLFEALTGELPFFGSVMEVLDWKQRLDAPKPSKLVEGVPQDLDELTVELLRRNPSLRPTPEEIVKRLSGQSTSAQIETDMDSVIEDSPFIGRQKHRAELLESFEQLAAGQTVICQIHGKSGTGKSSLIEHCLSELSELNYVLALTGRCYEQESVPYKAVDTLVDALTIYLMRLSDQQVEALIPQHISALARIFPVLKRVEAIECHTRGPEQTADLAELRRQAFGALRELLTRIGNRQPLILYIDDLQWGDVDSASLLFELLRPPNPPRLLLLVSYRSEYAGSTACIEALRALAGAEIRQVEIAVNPLSDQEAYELALELLRAKDAEAAERARRIADESGGSPYFIFELVRHLHAGLEIGGTREFNLDRVLWERVQRLPQEARQLLEVVAVSGQPTQLRYAQQAARLPMIDPHLIFTLRAHHLVRSSGPSLTDDFETYHDRIRESILANLSAEALKQHHANLADTLEAAGSVAPEILAAHFYGAAQLEQAGHYYEAAAEQAVHALAFERADEFFRRAESLAADTTRKARIQEKLIHFYTDLARFDDAYEVSYRAVQHFGVRIPRKFNPPSFALDLVRTKLLVGRRRIGDLIELPTMTDPDLIAATRLITATGKAAYQIRPELCIALMTKVVNLCLRHGNTPDCAIGYIAFGAIFLGGVLGSHKAGYEFGRLGLDLLAKYDNRNQRAEVNFLMGYFSSSWLRPATEAEKLWETTYQAGLETGDMFHTGCACCATVMSLFMRGAPLDEVWQQSERLIEFLRRVHLREPLGAMMAVRQAVCNLRGETDDRLSFNNRVNKVGSSGKDFQEDEFVRSLAGFGSRHFAHYYFIVKMQTLYLHGEYDQALEMANQSETYLKDSIGMLHGTEHYFYHALILARQLPRARGWKRLVYWRKLRSIHRKFRRWALDCPHNFQHKERLIAAEICCLRNNVRNALAAYCTAEQAAAQYGYLQVEALANDLSARLLESLGDQRQAADRRVKAQDGYRRWGAIAFAIPTTESGNFPDSYLQPLR